MRYSHEQPVHVLVLLQCWQAYTVSTTPSLRALCICVCVCVCVTDHYLQFWQRGIGKWSLHRQIALWLMSADRTANILEVNSTDCSWPWQKIQRGHLYKAKCHFLKLCHIFCSCREAGKHVWMSSVDKSGPCHHHVRALVVSLDCCTECVWSHTSFKRTFITFTRCYACLGKLPTYIQHAIRYMILIAENIWAFRWHYWRTHPH